EDLRRTMAELLRDLRDEKVDKELMRSVGKGSPELQTFVLRATAHLDDPKHLARVRKCLTNRDAAVRRAAAEVLAAHRDEEAVPTLRKLLAKPRAPQDLTVAMTALTAILAADPKWAEELVELSAHAERAVRNAAIDALAQRGSPPVEL